jgi:hypothetical protein
MPEQEHCEHVWKYDGKSCCYRLVCSRCDRTTRAYHVNGPLPNIGDPVKLDANTDTIEVIGSRVEAGGNI